MERYTRGFEVTRNSVDVEAGTFDAVVFTDGEATDGHRLDMAGADLPDEMPLFINHDPDPRSQLGTLRLLENTGHQAVYRGEIMTEGDGPQGEERRDILSKMALGHVKRMSGRFMALETKPRVELPEDHWAYVSHEEAKSSPRLRYGMLISKWTGEEGSIVGLGADKAAVARDDAEDLLVLWKDATRQLLDLEYHGETLYCVLEEVREEYRQDNGSEREVEDEPLPSTVESEEQEVQDLADLMPLLEEQEREALAVSNAWIKWRKGAEITDASLLASVMAFDEMYREKYRG